VEVVAATAAATAFRIWVVTTVELKNPAKKAQKDFKLLTLNRR
jgi:hypothetical protein